MIGNIIAFLIYTTLAILFIVAKSNPELAEKLANFFQVGLPENVGLGMLIFLAVANFIVLCLVGRAIKNLNERNGRVGTHILLLIGGIFAWDVFYILGGIFGIIGSHK